MIERRGILEIGKSIFDLLSDGQERTIYEIAKSVECRWSTALKALEFLKYIKVVKERKGDKSYKEDRLFKLRN